METVANVTSSNTSHRLKCNASGLFLSDATRHFEAITVTNRIERALPFPDRAAAEQAKKVVESMYGSFDWQPVAVA